jgi:hypothetical protein
MSENKDEACKYLDSLIEGGFFTQDGFCKLSHLKPSKDGANKFAVLRDVLLSRATILSKKTVLSAICATNLYASLRSMLLQNRQRTRTVARTAEGLSSVTTVRSTTRVAIMFLGVSVLLRVLPARMSFSQRVFTTNGFFIRYTTTQG